MIQLIYAVWKCPVCGHDHDPVKVTADKDGGHPTTSVLLKVDCENCHEEYIFGMQAMIAVFPKDKENLNFLHDIHIIDEQEELDL